MIISQDIKLMKDYPIGHYIIYIISLIFYVTKKFYSISLMIIKEILFVKMHGKEKKKKEMKSCLYPNNKNDRKWDKKTL